MSKLGMLATALSVVAVFEMTSTAIQAQSVSFRAKGRGAIYSPDTGETMGPGRATHMGRIVGSGLAFPTTDLGNGLFEWVALNYELVDAKGDKILLAGGGTVQFIPIGGGLFIAEWGGSFDVLGGTGRYASVGPADQPITVTACNDPFMLDEEGMPIEGDTWTYDWTLTGRIEWGRRK